MLISGQKSDQPRRLNSCPNSAIMRTTCWTWYKGCNEHNFHEIRRLTSYQKKCEKKQGRYRWNDNSTSSKHILMSRWYKDVGSLRKSEVMNLSTKQGNQSNENQLAFTLAMVGRKIASIHFYPVLHVIIVCIRPYRWIIATMIWLPTSNP